MKKWLPPLVGFFAGIAFAAWFNQGHFESPALQAFFDFLDAPSKWLVARLLTRLPSPSAGMGVLVPMLTLWYLYWGCLGGLAGLLLPICYKLIITRTAARTGSTAKKQMPEIHASGSRPSSEI